MPYEPENLKLWELPEYYMGAHWSDYYVFLGQHRDSDTLTRSNFQSALDLIGGETETVVVIHEGHWAVGWVEWIGIHKDDTSILRLANEIAAALSDYPVVDEDHFSDLEYTEAAEYWAGLSVRDRAGYIKEHSDASIFAARRDEIPSDDTGALFDALRG